MDVFSTATKVLLSESEGPPGGQGLSIPHSPTSNDVAQDMLFIEAKLYNEVASNTSSRQPLFGTNLQVFSFVILYPNYQKFYNTTFFF
jgi:hypothetical protein